jgi:hypothetical protein
MMGSGIGIVAFLASIIIDMVVPLSRSKPSS